MPSADPVERVRDALLRGRMSLDDLTTRRVGAMFGKTTSLLYHHYGSLDGFLFAVSQSGMRLLGEHLGAAAAAGADLSGLADAFVAFGLRSPALYALMFERKFDWAALRRAGALHPELPGLSMFAVLGEYLRAAGSEKPVRDARMLFAALHGLVSLAHSGRANIGDTKTTDHAAAREAAREITRRICPGTVRSDHEPSSNSGSSPSSQRRRASQPARQGRDERAARGRRRRAE